jgi:predicted permease
MPPGFDFPGGAEAWIPLRADREQSRDDKDLAVIARLSDGATLPQARGELRELARELAAAHPRANAGWSADAMAFSEWLIAPRFREAVWVIFGAVGALLLLACANVANLLVAHGTARLGEMRMRVAIGATRGRIVRQLLTEAAVLGGFGTATGILVSVWAVTAIQAMGSGLVPRVEDVRVDALVLAFACVVGLASCLAFGLAPALQAAGVEIRESSARYTSKSRKTRQALVVAEVAIALVLLVTAGLLANSFVRLLRADPGFETSRVVAMHLEVTPERYPDDRLAMFYTTLLDRVRALPGVVGAGASSTNPFQQFGFSNNVTPEERAAEAPPSGLVQAGWRSVTPGFLEAMGITLLAGRPFGSQDHADAEGVVLVSRRLAEQLWPAENPVGRRIYWGGTTGRTRQVIGVVSDFQDVQLGRQPEAMLLVPHAQISMPGMTVVVRTPLGADGIATALRHEVRQLDPALPAPVVQDLTSSVSAAAAGPRFNTALVGTFAAIAFVLAITGVYGMLMFSVSEQRREIAVRLALGAAPATLVRHVLGGALGLAVAGAMLGAAAAFGVTRVMRSLLYDVAPTDPMTFAVAILALIAAAGLACYLPARRASRLDPGLILRD